MSIRLLKGGEDLIASEEEMRSSDLERCESATEEFLDSVGREEHTVRKLNKEDKVKRKDMKKEDIFPLTLLCLGALLSSCVDSLSHVVLPDVVPGSESPQRISGALSPTGRTHRPPVLCYR